MPYLARNTIPIGSSYTPANTLTWPDAQTGATKLDVYVNSTDALAQFLEDSQGAWQFEESEEVLCRVGFNSIPVETPFFAVRFRVWPGTLLAASGTVDARLMA